MRKILFAALSLLAIGLTGCDDDGPTIDVESSIPVRVESVEMKPISAYALATGTVQAVSRARLVSQQSGYYKLRQNPATGKPFVMGDHVKAGQVIVRLDNPELENQISIESKRLNFDISQREFEKQKAIYEKGGITQRELVDAERMFIDARYSLANAELQLAKLSITAPFDGVIVDLPFFSNNQLVNASSVIAEIMDYSALYAEVELPGKEMERVRRGQSALVTNYGKSSDTLTGEVTQVSPALDPENRMFKVGVQIMNDSLLLRPGMFVRIDIIVAQRDSALVIPKKLLLERRRGKSVYVVEKSIAMERSLETGLSNRDEIEILSGLKAGEQLVVEGYETLRNRSRVKVTK